MLKKQGVRIPVILILLLLSLSANAQREITITGTIRDSLKTPIPYIDVLLKMNDSTQQILAFAITNENGQYRIVSALGHEPALVEVSALGFIKIQKPLPQNGANRYTFNFNLHESEEALEEIELKVEQRVHVKNDTTIFNLDRLTNGSERFVEDILKKLPGLEIQENGTFKFKGKKVVNVLLDGDNLFDGAYTIGTKTINSEHIQGVEAIENFEDNPLLQGLTATEEVALNLKFQDGFSFSGSADLGYGYQDRYYANATAIGLTKTIKAFTTLNYNNMGQKSSSTYFDPIGYMNSINGNNQISYKAPSYLSDKSNNSLSAGQHSIKNDALFGTINILPKLSKREEMRINLDYFSDQSLENNSTSTTINTDPANPILINTTNRHKKQPRYLNSKLYYRIFFTKKSSLQTQFKFSKLRNEEANNGFINSIQQGEHTLQKEYTFYNTTNYTHRINNKSAYKIDGLVAFSEVPETITLLTGIDFDTNNSVPNSTNYQDIFSKKQSFSLKGNYFIKTGKAHKFSTTIGLNYFKNHLQSSLLDTDQELAFNNNSNYTVFTPGVLMAYFLKFNSLEITPSIESSLYNYTHLDQINTTEQNGHVILINSSLKLTYEFIRNHNIFGTIASTDEAPDEKRLFTDYILQSNRRLWNNELNFDKQSSMNYNFGYRYSDLFKDYSASINFYHQKSNNTYFSTILYAPEVSYFTYFLRDLGAKNNTVSVDFSKYIRPLRTTFSVNSSYRTLHYFNIVNGSSIRENENNTYMINVDLATSFIGKFIFNNKTTYTDIAFESPSVNVTNKSLSNTFQAFYIPSSRFRIETELKYLVPEINNPKNRSTFLNTMIKFTNKKKSLTYKLEGKNLFNQKDINLLTNTDFSTKTSRQGIIERYFLLTVGFSF